MSQKLAFVIYPLGIFLIWVKFSVRLCSKAFITHLPKISEKNKFILKYLTDEYMLLRGK